MLTLLARFNARAERLPRNAVLLALRIFPVLVFLASGRTKLEGVTIKPSTWYLFENDYALPLVPGPVAAVLATGAEHLLPALMILGLASRLAALGLIGMTAVIEIFVYPEAWITHGLWATALLAGVAFGPGGWSLDRLLGLERAR